MPIMDGYEAAKIIKNDISKQVSKIPIIAMSAYTSKKDIKRALDSGMDDYIFKPFNPDTLYNILDKYGNINKQNEIKEIEISKDEIIKSKIETYIDLKFLRGETYNEASLLILLIKSFSKEIEEFLMVVDKEFKNKNWNQLHKATHKIKPNVSMFGISKLEPIIYKLEDNFREEKELENIEELISTCKQLFTQAKLELLTELNTLENE